jgi:hypothetical protein
MDAVKIIACPGCGSNHTVSVDALIGRDEDSLDLLCDDCEAEFNEVLDTDREDFYLDDEPWDGFRDDVEADADALASAGWGTDEDYGGYDDFDRDFGCEEW